VTSRGSVNPNSFVSRHVAAHEPRSWLQRTTIVVAAATWWATIVDRPDEGHAAEFVRFDPEIEP
jgi:hypothetical protein